MPKRVIPISGIIANFEMESESNVTPSTLRKSLEEAAGQDILITINSPGGLISSGLEMFSLIKNYPGEVETRIVAIAASMGSILALAGNQKSAENTALYFVHNAQGFEVGDYRDLAKKSNLLKDLSDLLANLYAEYTNLSIKEARQLMDAESQFFGNDLELLGFEIVEAGNETTEPEAKLNAQSKFTDVKNKLSKEEHPKDLEKAVALIDYEKFGIKNKTEPQEISHPVASTTEIDNALNTLQTKVATNPASAGKNNMEVNMTFKEYLAQNPEAMAEYNSAIADAEKRGAEAVQKRVETASKFLTAESNYPEAITNLAVKVVNGETDAMALTAAVAAVDAITEKTNSDAAGEEVKAQGHTPADSGNVAGDAKGDIKTPADYAAAIADGKKELGLEVS